MTLFTQKNMIHTLLNMVIFAGATTAVLYIDTIKALLQSYGLSSELVILISSFVLLIAKELLLNLPKKDATIPEKQ